MSIFLGWGARARGLFADNKGPWGSSSGDGDEPPTPDGGTGPWGDPPRRKRQSSSGGPSPALDDFLRRSRARFSGGGFPGTPNRSIVTWVVLALVLLWLVGTSMHSISPGQRGVVRRFGRYSAQLGPGIGWT